MKLSEYNIEAKWNSETRLYEGGILPFDYIDEIVYKGIEDKGISCESALVFGNSRKIEMKARVEKAVELYKMGRIKKMLFTGGKKGISSKGMNQTPKYINEQCTDISEIFDDDFSEAERMKSYAIELGVKEDDIFIETKSNNSLETFSNAKNILNLQDGDSLILVTSGYHMKRCYAGALKYLSLAINYGFAVADTGHFEKENYQNSALGIQLANFDANHIVRQAREGLIYDIDNSDLIQNIKR